jgi:xylulokinase
MAHDVFQSVGDTARLLLAQLEQAAGFPAAAFRRSGGGARSDLCCRIKADMMDRPIHRLTNIDTAAFGGADCGRRHRRLY